MARLEILGDVPNAVCAEICEYDSVTDLTVIESVAGIDLVQVETTVPFLVTSLLDSGVLPEMPFEVRDGEMVLEAMIPQETLSELGTVLDKFGIRYTVERIQQENDQSSSGTTSRVHSSTVSNTLSGTACS